VPKRSSFSQLKDQQLLKVKNIAENDQQLLKVKNIGEKDQQLLKVNT
jgi:hypothetical protein